jgi:hypothetical protein
MFRLSVRRATRIAEMRDRRVTAAFALDAVVAGLFPHDYADHGSVARPASSQNRHFPSSAARRCVLVLQRIVTISCSHDLASVHGCLGVRPNTIAISDRGCQLRSNCCLGDSSLHFWPESARSTGCFALDWPSGRTRNMWMDVGSRTARFRHLPDLHDLDLRGGNDDLLLLATGEVCNYVTLFCRSRCNA